MCGRFALTLDPTDLQQAFPGFDFPEHVIPRYNIAPSQPILALPNDGKALAGFFVWGLVPSWAKDPTIGNRMINARAETLSEKPAFRAAYKYHRCLILADGFYEWQPQPGSKAKQPFLIRLKGGTPFAFAGLWERWQPADGSQLLSATIITTAANSLVAGIHDRMPVILSRDAYTQWLDPVPQGAERMQDLLRPYPAEGMEAFPVSTLVNSPGNDRAEVQIQV